MMNSLVFAMIATLSTRPGIIMQLPESAVESGGVRKNIGRGRLAGHAKQACLTHVPKRAKQRVNSVGLCSGPGSMTHGFDDGGGGEVVEVAGGRCDRGVAELLGDDGDVDAFGAELGGVGVAEAVGVDAFVDAGPAGEALQHDPDVGGGHRPAAE
jgi:hypothetical protein